MSVDRCREHGWQTHLAGPDTFNQGWRAVSDDEQDTKHDELTFQIVVDHGGHRLSVVALRKHTITLPLSATTRRAS